MIILGIDPGNVRAGYGLIKREGKKFTYLDGGVLNIRNSKDFGNQLCFLEKDLKKLIKRCRPDIIGLEKLFASKNLKTVMRVAEARGVIHKTIAESKIRLVELPPQTIKLSVTGNGRADKGAVAKITGLMLHLDVRKLLDDTTDALAIAIAASSDQVQGGD